MASNQVNSSSWPTWKSRQSSRFLTSWEEWLEIKKEKDGAEGLWRIHDSLYDLNKWAESHPGGSEWITLTKGTDVTEAFESHHMTETAYKILPKFFIKEASTPRNAPFTFKADRFYKILKGRVARELENVPKGPSPNSIMIMDTLAITTVILSVLAARLDSTIIAILAGLFLASTAICAHNFFHQRNNWRMYYFSLSMLSVRFWRVSHAMSHHLFPNSINDLEIILFEPMLQWLPKPNKSFITRFVSWIYSPIIYMMLFHTQYIFRLMFNPEGVTDLIPLIMPLTMILAGSSVWQAFLWWNLIVIIGSFTFGLVGLNAAHHHPELLHDGDEPREDLDWGLYQLDAVRDRVEIKGILPLELVLFGSHCLHHLFPTVDHAHLDRLYPILQQTCMEFGIPIKMGTVWDLVKGQFLQLARITRISFRK